MENGIPTNENGTSSVDIDVTVKLNPDGSTAIPQTGSGSRRITLHSGMTQLATPPPPISDKTAEPVHAAPLDGTYRKGNCFAVGGQAEIFKGEDLNLHRQVAIKSLRAELIDRPDARAAFINEARITAQLDHPGIVPIYSINTDEHGGLHLTMKIIRGTSLKTRFDEITKAYEENRVSINHESTRLAERLEIVLRICDALAYAHSRNVMHCDLKPENVMLGEAGEAYLMDWGLARLIHEPDFDPGKWKTPQKIAGTPRYLSPEAANGLYCDQRADIYSLGLILYEMVFLAPAFEGNDYTMLLHRIRHGAMRPLRHRFKYEVSPDIKAIVLKAIAPRREERYSSVDDLAADLRRFLRGEAVSARRESWFGKLARWCARRQRLMLLLVLTGLLLGAIGILSTLYHRIYREKEHNQQALAIREALDRCSQSGFLLDRMLTRYELLLSAASDAVMHLRDAADQNPAVGAAPRAAGTTAKKKSAAPRAAGKTAKKKTAAAAQPSKGNEGCSLAWHLAPGAKVPHLRQQLAGIALLKPRIRRLLRGDAERQSGDASRSGLPVSRVYFGFDDGLLLLFPASPIASGFDPRRQPWYAEGMKKDGFQDAIWGRHVLGEGKDPVLRCTIPMIDATGRFHGVAGLDLQLSELVAALRKNGNCGDMVLEKFLIDGNGNTLISGSELQPRDEDAGDAEAEAEREEPGAKKAKNEAKTGLDAALKRILLKKNNGFVIRHEGDRDTVYLCWQLISADWRYIEKLDLDTLICNKMHQSR